MSRPPEKIGRSNVWLTPEDILEPTREYFGGPIPLDPCTTSDNPTKATRFFTEEDDGLAQPWDYPVFMNPPYSNSEHLYTVKTRGEELFGLPRRMFSSQIVLWTAKVLQESRRHTPIIALLPCGARFSTEYWQDHILSSHLNAICFKRGRAAFIDEATGKAAKGNIYDSQILGYNVDIDRFCRAFGKIGSAFGVNWRHQDAVTRLSRVAGTDSSSRLQPAGID
jgi:hypothetical protein